MNIIARIVKTLILTALIFGPGIYPKASERVIGTAYHTESGDVMYSEEHIYMSDNHHQVIYREKDGSVFAEKMLDYSESEFMPDFYHENTRNGEIVAVNVNAKTIEVNYRRSLNSNQKKDALDHSGIVIVDAGFDKFIQANWNKLVGGEKLEFDYLIPVRSKTFTLSLQGKKCNVPGRACFEISTASLLLGILVRSIHLEYNVETKSLLRFKGKSNISN